MALSPSHGRPEDQLLDFKRLTTIPELQDDDRLQRDAPKHPIPGLQRPLEDALKENINPTKARRRAQAQKKVDPAMRRRMMLQGVKPEQTYAARWRSQPGDRYHPLTKLVAQITFGVHLLQQKLLPSDEDVVRLLQTYVGEMDAFLEQTTEDLDLSLADVDERIKCLRLPLEHDELFDAMLDDRVFRKQIVDGNDKIEVIIRRTEDAMTNALHDVQQGLEANKELAKYLVRLDHLWTPRTEQHEDVYAAMSANSEGWFRCFFSLQTKGHSLRGLLIQLELVVAELQRRAGIASRKNLTSLITDGKDTDIPVRTVSPPPTKPGRYHPLVVTIPLDAKRPPPRMNESPHKLITRVTYTRAGRLRRLSFETEKSCLRKLPFARMNEAHVGLGVVVSAEASTTISGNVDVRDDDVTFNIANASKK
ncbi:MAG: hypothetical protein M1826_000560 [Phylliscum demangeonii]|nr:MAG: hypothetical protein M1826_000560 [Phylliscum demangeonii]